ncbi:MAG: 3-oxoacyl-ACP reductase FabG [Chloroflexota bacterium]|nr:3-oxoacyl-ACP reductase FabG [Chloroflexota bacterium]
MTLSFDTSRAALVTGASRGIGRACAVALAAHGVPVAVNYRRSSAEADALVDQIVAGGGKAVALQADIADTSEAVALVERAESELGGLGILVNNAGITRDKLLLQMGEEDWDVIWRTDLVGPRAAARRAIRSMRDVGGGRIINISSVVGSTGNAGQANYAAAKAGLAGLTRELAVEAAPALVSVNCVVPGYIHTDATAYLTDEQKAVWQRRIPMERVGRVEDVATLVLFLASQEAWYISGQCIGIDGGLLAKSGRGFASS